MAYPTETQQAVHKAAHWTSEIGGPDGLQVCPPTSSLKLPGRFVLSGVFCGVMG